MKSRPKLLKEKFPRKKKEKMIVAKKTVPVIDRPGVKKEINSARVSQTKRRLVENEKARKALLEQKKSKKKEEHDRTRKRVEGLMPITKVNIPYNKALEAAQHAKVPLVVVGVDKYVDPKHVDKLLRFHKKTQKSVILNRTKDDRRRKTKAKRSKGVKKIIKLPEPVKLPQSIKREKDAGKFIQKMGKHLDKLSENQLSEWKELAHEGLRKRGMSEEGAGFMVWKQLKG